MFRQSLFWFSRDFPLEKLTEICSGIYNPNNPVVILLSRWSSSDSVDRGRSIIRVTEFTEHETGSENE